MDSCAEDAWLSIPLFAIAFPYFPEAVDEGEQGIGGIVWHGVVFL